MVTNRTEPRTVRNDELKAGDVIVFFGGYHRIDRIDPPTEATLAIAPDCIGYAMAEDGWGITLSCPWQTKEVV